MSSPLLEYANAWVYIPTTTSPTITSGRITTTAGPSYLIRAFLKRQQSASTTTGSTRIPVDARRDRYMPGASGEQYLYRGYALQSTTVPDGHDWLTDDNTTLTYVDLLTTPSWLPAGLQVSFTQGSEGPYVARVARSTGKYGGTNIDEIIQSEIQGIELILESGELQD